MRHWIALWLCLLFPLTLSAETGLNSTVHEVRYDANLSDHEARLAVDLDIETTGKGEATVPLFSGDIAVTGSKLPANLRLVRQGGQYGVVVTRAGRYKFKLDLVAKIQRQEPWNQVAFTGPEAAIASVTAQAAGAGVEVQLLKGTLQDTSAKDGLARVKGFLGSERQVSLRWSRERGAEVARKALLTCETTASAQITPTVVKYVTQLRYEILQGNISRLTVSLPADQALTKLQGEGVRDWQTKPVEGGQLLTVDFIQPLDKAYLLTLLTEQPVENSAATASVVPPQPREVERETGSLSLTAEDVLVETDTLSGLRQVNAVWSALAAYQFYARPFSLKVKLRRIEPVVNAVDRVTVRVEESRMLVNHALTVTVEKAGIYSLELTPPAGFAVADVRGDGLEDWKSANGKLNLAFNARVLGSRRVDVQLERAFTGRGKSQRLEVAAVRVTGAVREMAQIGVAGSAGLQLKTVTEALKNVREIAITRLANRMDETLAYNADQADWLLTLAVDPMAAHITADVFNLVTIGDGLLGGSATIRYAIINQGVQEFRVRMPSRWKNVEFTGPNIRRKEQQDDVWVISLQEKAWGGYTLVVTYDYQFDPHKASLAIGGIHCENVERETGSIAIAGAADLQVQEVNNTGANHNTPETASGFTSLDRIDEAELADNDRALINRPVLLAYRYAGQDYDLSLDVTRFDALPVLDAAADRTQLTTVLTEDGQMLTQASFMVKNNDRQFQTFTLPEGATFWSCYVRGEPAKPETSGNRLLVPLPRQLDRDQAFSVDIVYAQKIGALRHLTPHRLALSAPQTDMQTTYAEWEVYVPTTMRLAGFGGNMIVAGGTTYGMHEAWQQVREFYRDLGNQPEAVIISTLCLAMLALIVVMFLRRRWVLGFAMMVVLACVGGLWIIGSVRLAGSTPTHVAQFACEVAPAAAPVPDNAEALAPVVVHAPRTASTVIDESKTKLLVSGTSSLIGNGSSNNLVVVNGGSVWTNSSVLTIGSAGGLGGGGFMRNNNLVILTNSAFLADQVNNQSFARSAFEDSGLTSDGFDKKVSVTNVGALAGVNYFGGNVTVAGGTLVTGSGSAQQNASAVMMMPPPPATTVSGIRPIHIELPKTGQRFVFTKVLNVRAEPLSVVASAMEEHVFNLVCGAARTFVLLLGIVLLAWQWRRVEPNSLWLTLGLALTLGGVGSLLVEWRMLHTTIILAVPVTLFLLLVWLLKKLVKRKEKKVVERRDPFGGGENPVADGGSAVPPVVVGILLMLAIGGSAKAGDVLGGNPNSLGDPWQMQRAEAAAVLQPTTGATLVSANYTGLIRALDTKEAARAAQLEAVLVLNTTSDNQTVPLFGEEVVVEEFTASPATVKLVRDGHSMSALVPRKGTATVRVKFLVKTTGDVAGRRMAFGIPPALTSHVAITLDEADAQVEAPTAVSFKATASGQQTVVDAIFGASERVELNWTPRVRRAAEVATTVFCNNAALVTVAGGAVDVRAMLDYQVTQGELRQMRVAIPAGQHLMRVEGESIRTWRLDGQTLTVDLVKGVTPSYRLTVETEQVAENMAGSPTVALSIPHALDVQRETGLVGLKAADELSVSLAEQKELQKVDVDEFTRVMANTGVTSAYRFLKPDFRLALHVEPVQSQIEAQVWNQFRVTGEEVALRATISFMIKRAGVFTLRAALPDDYRVENVGGVNIAQWIEKPGTPRVLEVTLKTRTAGGYSLTVDLVRTLTALPKSLELTGVQPLDTQKLSGYVAASAEEGVQIKTEAFDGLLEVPAATLGMKAAPGLLGFKLIPSDAASATPTWKLTVGTEKIESWVRAEVWNVVTLSDTLVSGRSIIRYEIANAPTKEFRVRAPAKFRNVEVTGANIRRKDHDEQAGEWRIELQNKVRGSYELTVTWEMPWDGKSGSLDLAGVESPGVERETGMIAIFAPARLRVEAKGLTADLLRMDARDLPERMTQSGVELPVLAYRYLRPGFQLGLTTQRFDEAEVLQALVDGVQLTTVVSEDGQMMTEMNLAVRNNARQYLEITLPPGTTNVWSAFVGGQPVRPSVRNGKLLLPMERSQGEATVPVEVTYVGSSPFPRDRGHVELVSPALDVPLKNAHWELYLPPDYLYGQFAGTMKREVTEAVTTDEEQVAAPQVRWSYGYSDYAAEENRKQAAVQSDVASSLMSARTELSSGNLKGANGYMSKVRLNSASTANAPEYKELEKQVQVAQANNLIQGQQSFEVGNGAVVINRLIEGDVAGKQNYDRDAAVQQALKLQAAQEVTVAKAAPLRVNLPKRGVLFSFEQVLQTQPGRAMEVTFTATSDRGTSWPVKIVTGGVMFAALWGFIAMWLIRRKS